MALPPTGQLVEAIEPEHWALPTPCPEWTVRGVVNHLVVGHLLFTAALADSPTPSHEQMVAALGTDRLGADPSGAYRSSADGLLAGFRSDGALDRLVTVPVGTLPGLVACELRVVEALVHGWDLARATGLPLSFPDDLVEQSIGFSRLQLSRLPPGRTPFGPSQDVAHDAPPLDRLAALLGRVVEGSPSDA
jgi:uncharacterized protein (TIGR03086 family)